MEHNPILEIEDVTFVAGGNTILDRASWSIRPGEHWAILGPNGSGKTTLLRIAAGFLWPNAGGMVRRLGRQLIDLRELRRSIGWVSSNMIHRVPNHEAALDTVVSGRLAQLGLKCFRGCAPTEDDYAAARQQMELIGCSALVARPFGVLSQGEKQSVLVARARMAEPLLIILDEPCAGMDPGVRERFLATLGTSLEADTTPSLALVTHHVEEILPMLDRTLIVRDGRTHHSGRTRELITAERLSELYGITVAEVVQRNGRYWPIFA